MIKVVRTLSNLMIIGEVSESEHLIDIKKPYSMLPQAEGIELFPLDSGLLGKELDEITMLRTVIIYTTEASQVLKEYYEKASSSTLAQPQIITG